MVTTSTEATAQAKVIAQTQVRYSLAPQLLASSAMFARCAAEIEFQDPVP
jgi:hypothetical protein